MATLTQNGINFTLDAESVTPFGGKYVNRSNFDDSTGLYNVNQNKLNNLGVSMSFNAVEIDWNGAELNLPDDLGGTKTINTTGELLKERLQYNSPMFAKVA